MSSSANNANNAKTVTVSWEPAVAKKIIELKEARMSTLTRTTNDDGHGQRQRQRQCQPPPVIVGIVGIPGSGKTTSCDILGSLVPGSLVVPMDGFHLSLATLSKLPNAQDAIYRRGAPDTFDPKGLEHALYKIRYGGGGGVNDQQQDQKQQQQQYHSLVSIPGFDHAKGDPEENQFMFIREKHSVVICEGLYLLHDRDGWANIKSFLDWTIFISADIDDCMDRLKERNKCIPGYTPEEIEIRCDVVDRANARTVIQSSKDRADLVVESAAATAAAAATTN